MINPELIALEIAAARCVLRLMDSMIDALTQRIVLHGQVELVRAAASTATAVESFVTTRRGLTRHLVINSRAVRGQL